MRAVHIGRGSCRQCANEKKCAAVLHVWWDVCAVCCVYGKRDKIQAVVGGLHNFSLRSAPNRKATATDNGNNNRKRNIFSRSRWCAWKVVFMRAQAIVIVYAQQFSPLCTGQVFMCAHLLAVRWKSARKFFFSFFFFKTKTDVHANQTRTEKHTVSQTPFVRLNFWLRLDEWWFLSNIYSWRCSIF